MDFTETCPECGTLCTNHRTNYTGEGGCDGMDFFYRCAACGTEFETWHSRGTGGYTLCWKGQQKDIVRPEDHPGRGARPPKPRSIPLN